VQELMISDIMPAHVTDRTSMRGWQVIPFSKYHGLGNDFIVVAAGVNAGRQPRKPVRAISGARLGMLARSICDRHTGIGADGLLLLTSARKERHSARMRVFNADGSEAEMSGNGIRCAAAYLVARNGPPRRLEVETAAGVKSVEPVSVPAKTGRVRSHRKSPWVFRVGMGVPILDPARIPFKYGGTAAPVVGFPLSTRNGIVHATVTSMGNPHCSLLVNDFEQIDWLELGRELETNELFPNRTNVEFIRVISRTEIEVRYWERGVGKTQSSGTGSCAAVAACILNGLTDRKVQVRTLSGRLDIEWPDAENQGNPAELVLTGPAELIAEGTYYF
jgi:diaminopimelate epimerase